MEPAVTPPDTFAREMDLLLPVVAAAHNHTNLVPVERHRVLDTYGLTDTQLRKGSGVLVIASLHLGRSQSSILACHSLEKDSGMQEQRGWPNRCWAGNRPVKVGVLCSSRVPLANTSVLMLLNEVFQQNNGTS